MSKLHFTTQHANEATVQRDWWVVDGTNQTVGRMCARIAAVLRGKNKVYYTPHVDCGDFVIVTNVDKVLFSGNKLEDKIYINFSGYPGGKKEETAKSLLKRAEIRSSRFVENDRLAIDDRGPTDLACCISDCRETMCPIVAAARQDTNALRFDMDSQAITIPLDFIDPFRPLRRLGDRQSEARLDTVRH